MNLGFTKFTDPHSAVRDMRRQISHSQRREVLDAVEQLQAVESFDWCCIAAAPDAPGILVTYGVLEAQTGEINSFSGSNDNLVGSLGSAVGEASEFAAIFDSTYDTEPSTTAEFNPSNVGLLTGGWLDSLQDLSTCHTTVTAERLSDHQRKLVPAAICYAKPYFSTGLDKLVSLSSGLGSGTTALDAIEHGLFEIIEHDAVVNWWISGYKPRQLHRSEIVESQEYLLRLRQGNPGGRTTNLLLLRSSTELPVVAAVSFDKHGQCFACGTACRYNIITAVNSAIREMCLMEFGHHVVRAKIQENGLCGLSKNDHDQINRARIIDRKSFLRLIDDHESHLASELADSCFGPSLDKSPEHLMQRAAQKVDAHVFHYPDKSGRAHVCKVLSSKLKPLLKSEENNAPTGSVSSSGSPYRLFEGVMP